MPKSVNSPRIFWLLIPPPKSSHYGKMQFLSTSFLTSKFKFNVLRYSITGFFFWQKLEFCHSVLAITLTNTEKLAFWIKSNQKSLKGSYSIYVQKLPLPKVPPKRKRIYRIIGYRFSLMFIIGRAFFGQGPFLKNKQKIIFAIFCNWNILRSTLRSTQWLFVVDGWQSFVWLN